MIYICVYIYIYITYTFMYNKGNRIIFFKFLQCCAGLCIQQGKSAIVYVYSLPPQPSPPLPSPSLQVTTEHHIRLPVLQSNSHQPAILRWLMDICHCYFPHVSYSLLPPLFTSPFSTSVSPFLP